MSRLLFLCLAFVMPLTSVPCPGGTFRPGIIIDDDNHVRPFKKERADLSTRPEVMLRQKIRFLNYHVTASSIADINNVHSIPHKKPTQKLPSPFSVFPFSGSSSFPCHVPQCPHLSPVYGAPQFWHLLLISFLVLISHLFDVRKILVFLFPFSDAVYQTGPVGTFHIVLILVWLCRTQKEKRQTIPGPPFLVKVMSANQSFLQYSPPASIIMSV